MWKLESLEVSTITVKGIRDSVLSHRYTHTPKDLTRAVMILGQANLRETQMNESDLSIFLEGLRAEAETKIKNELSGPLSLGKRLLYDVIMPLHVNITADPQECRLEFLPGGSIRLNRILAVSPDVTVKGELETIRTLIIHRSARMFEVAERNGEISVTSHTWKGRQAVQKVRELLGSSSV